VKTIDTHILTSIIKSTGFNNVNKHIKILINLKRFSFTFMSTSSSDHFVIDFPFFSSFFCIRKVLHYFFLLSSISLYFTHFEFLFSLHNFSSSVSYLWLDLYCQIKLFNHFSYQKRLFQFDSHTLSYFLTFSMTKIR